MSEIDDIFASKGKKKEAPPASSAFLKPSAKKEKKKKKLTNLSEDEILSKPESASDVVSNSKKRPLPETVVDTSDLLASPAKRQKGMSTSDDKKSKSTKADKKKSEVDVDFKDSRGTGSRRTTEEGWLVYKEDELGIGDQGGDTPLCPFDCDCCF